MTLGTTDGAPTSLESPARQIIELDVQGMTCASCAARIEKKLSKLDGVQASVNYATEKAHVVAPAGLTADDLIATVQAAGYDAALPVHADHAEPAFTEKLHSCPPHTPSGASDQDGFL